MRIMQGVLMVIGLATIVAGSSEAWAGAGNEGDPACVVNRNTATDPSGIKLTGTIAVDIDAGTGITDVMLRLNQAGNIQFFRRQFAGLNLTVPTLSSLHNRLCEILMTNPDALSSTIFSQFNLSGQTKIVFTTRAITNTQVVASDNNNGNSIISSEQDLRVGDSNHYMTIADIVVFTTR